MALQFCVVCGRGSQRASWPRSGAVNGISYVSCDFHSQSAIDMQTIDSGGIASTVTIFPAQNGKIRKTVQDSGGE